MVNSKYKFKLTVASVITVIMLIVSCTVKAPSDLTKEGIIPKPVSITATGDYFKLRAGAAICVSADQAELKSVAQYLAGKLKPATGFAFEVSASAENEKPGSIYLILAVDSSKLGEEGYNLTITRQDLKLTAKSLAGLFRGVQTIRQLLPPAIEQNTLQKRSWEIATGTITDYPEYSYRGAMLDVSRHFFSAEDVKKYIDQISYYKMNALHLHLSDDQGWRIEIKSWPELANHGGTTQVGGGKGGYYTQEQYSDIVKYAQERYVTIIPEIDMPGHTNAALSSYAELNCDGKSRELFSKTDVGFSSLCTKKEVTYKFINDVMKELASLTPGPYIHIGGDESHATKKEDYIPFMNRVQDIVNSYNKKVIAWDEIADATVKNGTIAQYWANSKNAAEAVKQGAKILLSPAAKAYLDMQYDSTSKFGLHWAAYIEVDSAYIWDPAKMIPGVGKENILGVEAPLWSETIANMDEIEYLAYPRLLGIAEIGWTSPALRNWNDYRVRLGKHGERMKVMGIHYYPSKQVPWSDIQTTN
jgi:hexosaminidase